MDKNLILAIHIIPAMSAILAGFFMIILKKGTEQHRRIGRLWCVLMFSTALTSFLIPAEQLMIFAEVSYLHILAIATLVMIPLSLWALHTGKRKVHGGLMVSLYCLLCITGIAAMFMPGRILHTLFF